MPRSKPFTLFGRSSSLLMLIFYKLLLAVIDVLAGALCLVGAFFIKHPELFDAIKKAATTDNLDVSANWIFQQLVNWKLDYQLLEQIGLIVIAFGLFNILLAVGVWFRSHKMRLIALIVFGGLCVYNIINLIQSFSTLDLVSLLLDLTVLYYFWRILPKHFEQ